NSLFLLDKQNEIIENIHKVLTDKGNVFFIIPNINSINYINFKKNNQHVNSLELDKYEFIQYIEKFNFKLVTCKPICYANIYGRKELRFFSILAPFYLRVLNFFMSAFKTGTPSYYLFSFQRA
ncbi:MAG TPA: hypothetical protein VFL70_05225, partial [Bacteroidia bacterium]|nr:hypothetical protein [Bacteroidia bacterium]